MTLINNEFRYDFLIQESDLPIFVKNPDYK